MKKRGRPWKYNPDVKPKTLICTTCKIVKPVSSFDLYRTMSRGYQYACKPCARIIQRKYSFNRSPQSKRKHYENTLRSDYKYPDRILKQSCGCRPPLERY